MFLSQIRYKPARSTTSTCASTVSTTCVDKPLLNIIPLERKVCIFSTNIPFVVILINYTADDMENKTLMRHYPHLYYQIWQRQLYVRVCYSLIPSAILIFSNRILLLHFREVRGNVDIAD